MDFMISVVLVLFPCDLSGGVIETCQAPRTGRAIISETRRIESHIRLTLPLAIGHKHVERVIHDNRQFGLRGFENGGADNHGHGLIGIG